jgi:hypothetical protein
MSKHTLALLVALTLTTSAFSQLRDPMQAARSMSPEAAMSVTKPNAAAPAATSTCAYTFTSGGVGAKEYLQYCVTVNGNIVEFQSPSGIEHIRLGSFAEGYAVCDLNSNVGYHDYADDGDSDTGNWGAPVLQTLNATTVKIARNTTDGIWTLTQTFGQNATDASVRVTMALKNNTAVARSVWLTRFADIDGGGAFSNISDGTINSVFGYKASLGYGLQLSLLSADPFTHYGWASPSVNSACNIGSGYAGLQNGVDTVQYYYHGISIPAHGTKTIVLKYKGI